MDSIDPEYFGSKCFVGEIDAFVFGKWGYADESGVIVFVNEPKNNEIGGVVDWIGDFAFGNVGSVYQNQGSGDGNFRSDDGGGALLFKAGALLRRLSRIT